MSSLEDAIDKHVSQEYEWPPACVDCKFIFCRINTTYNPTSLGEEYKKDYECHRRSPGENGWWPLVETDDWCGEYEEHPNGKQPKLTDLVSEIPY